MRVCSWFTCQYFVFISPAVAMAAWTCLYFQGEMERCRRSSEVALWFGDSVEFRRIAFKSIHRRASAQSGGPQKRSSEPREICGTGGEKKVKSGSRRSSGLPSPPEPGSTLPSAGRSTTCLQGPVCLARSSIRAAYIHVSAEEPPSPDEPAATTHLQTEGGG